MNENLEAAPIQDMRPSTKPGHHGTMSEKEYKRQATEILRDHDVNIRFLSIGCVIRVECKEIAFEDRDKAMVELMDYVRDPHTATKRWQQRFDQ